MMLVLRLARKEWQHALNSYVAYFIIASFAIALPMPLFFNASATNVFLSGVADLRPLFAALPLFMMLFVPALSMRAWTYETQIGTIESLRSYPIATHRLVLGKFLGNYSLIVVALLVTLPLPYLVNSMGSLDWGVVASAYFGAFLLGGACLALSLLLGSLARDQVSAFVLGLAVLATLMFVPVPEINFHLRFANLAGGLIYLKDALFYVLFTLFCLVLNMRVLKMRQRFY